MWHRWLISRAKPSGGFWDPTDFGRKTPKPSDGERLKTTNQQALGDQTLLYPTLAAFAIIVASAGH
jgi:hypothetical protein